MRKQCLIKYGIPHKYSITITFLLTVKRKTHLEFPTVQFLVKGLLELAVHLVLFRHPHTSHPSLGTRTADTESSQNSHS